MGRTLCVWFPKWPLRDGQPGRPCIVIDTDNRVVAVNEEATSDGVSMGMRRGEAEALCPGGVTLERDLGAEVAAFEPVITAVEQVVPRVEVAAPGLAFVRIEGAVRYYGGEETVLAEVVSAVEERVEGGLFAIAEGPFAARLAAAPLPGRIVHDDAAFLSDLDVRVLGMDELVATFRWLGVHTLGSLARLPRAAVVTRFGNDGAQAHRLASGEDRTPAPRAIPENVVVENRFEEPLVLVEQAGFAARSLARRLIEALGGVAPHRIEITVVAADGTERLRVWRSSDPFNEAMMADRVWWQLRAWMESAGVPGGIASIRIVPADLSSEGRALSLFEDVAARLEAERALARVQTLAGSDAVLQATPRGGRSPTGRVRWRRWGEEARREDGSPWPGATPSPAPALVVPEPRPIDIEWDGGVPVRVRLRSRWEEVVSWAGPWRETGRWWNGEMVANRYQVVTSAGALLCEVRDGRTYLTGVYD
ncbi:MAG: DNA polymerase Y family protein [Acidimicrobiia bacterium]